MKLSYYKFQLPKELLADKPSEFRDESRLMVVNRKDLSIQHLQFKNLVDFVDCGDVMVANNTKVFPARLEGTKEKTEAKIKIFLLRELNEETLLWDVIVDPARKIRVGNKLYFGSNESLVAEVCDNTTSRGRTIRFMFDGSHDEFIHTIKSLGQPPIPEDMYLRRGIKSYDKERYQTIYASVEGAVMAPNTGLHFSHQLLKRLEIKDVNWTELTLHIGLNCPIEVEDLSKHRMSSEEMHIDGATCDTINNAKKNGHKICCVGASTLRAIESAVLVPGKICPFDGWTNKFIFHPYEFSVADMLVTSFHMPQSSQFIMTSAFCTPQLLHHAYEVAIAEKYRFSTYGDSMLII
ncbi:MAG: tRNA preQ1(34) S-adenosylmethionine ribosyltransferase-isomerase QueA [Bacteroidales bacterium]|nr:tRNA preQ1(34) S-adenosylmethionine ribosyltransferase-isomerase QueA [Candidatus Colimorpha onthohippi]